MTLASAEPRATTAPLRRLQGSDDGPGRVRGGALPASLRERYGGELAIPLVDGRPTVIANFVSTLDGIVSFGAAGSGGGEVSGFFEPDRFVMALLRALADVVVVGAGTVRADPRARWISESVHPGSATDTAGLRAELGLAPHPTTVVVTNSGELDLGQAGLSDPRIPVLVVTTSAGRERLESGVIAPHLEVVATGEEGVTPHALLALLAERGVELVLSEGGPHLLGQLVRARLLDELFLTIAPQLAGRDRDVDRLALIEGAAFGVDAAPWGVLVDLRVSGSHLFNRYRFGGQWQ